MNEVLFIKMGKCLLGLGVSNGILEKISFL